MSTTRLYPAAALLRDGRVLVVGGASCGGCPDAALRSAEIYDTATGKWGGTGSTLEAFQSPTAALLPDGRVLVTGGNWGTWTRADYRTPAEIYDPATGAFTATATMVDVRDAYPLSGPYTSTLLADSRVLFTGGTYQADPAPQIGSGVGYRTSAEVYDPVTGTFSRTGSMKAGRESAQAVRLQDGRVLVMGGDQDVSAGA